MSHVVVMIVDGFLFGIGFAIAVGGVFIISQAVMDKLLSGLFLD